MDKKELQNLIDECKELLEQTEPYQRKMKAGHSRKKKRVIGHGGQQNTPPYTEKPSMERSKSAPPIGENLDETIRKKGSEYCLYSKKSGKNLGCYPTKEGAKKRERQVQYFKSLEEIKMSDIMGLFTQEPSKPKVKYTDYNKVYDRIYVGSAPIMGGKLIEDAVSRFGRIFIMSKEVADLIKDKLPDNVDIAYAIEDTLDPTQDEKTKLKQVAVKAKAFLKTHPKSDVLFACSKGLNRSAAGACLTMIVLGVKPDDAIERVEAVKQQK